MKTNFFSTKEEYLNMKQQWATYFNTEARNLKRTEYGNKIPKLTPLHFAVYAILQGKDPAKGLVNATDNGYGSTMSELRADIRWAKRQSIPANIKSIFDSYMELFGTTKETTLLALTILEQLFDECSEVTFKDIEAHYTAEECLA